MPVCVHVSARLACESLRGVPWSVRASHKLKVDPELALLQVARDGLLHLACPGLEGAVRVGQYERGVGARICDCFVTTVWVCVSMRVPVGVRVSAGLVCESLRGPPWSPASVRASHKLELDPQLALLRVASDGLLHFVYPGLGGAVRWGSVREWV